MDITEDNSNLKSATLSENQWTLLVLYIPTTSQQTYLYKNNTLSVLLFVYQFKMTKVIRWISHRIAPTEDKNMDKKVYIDKNKKCSIVVDAFSQIPKAYAIINFLCYKCNRRTFKYGTLKWIMVARERRKSVEKTSKLFYKSWLMRKGCQMKQEAVSTNDRHSNCWT